MGDKEAEDIPMKRFLPDIDGSHLIKDGSQGKSSKYVCKITVKPQIPQKVSLGNFSADNPPKGFSIEFVPDPHPEGSVTSQITSLGTQEKYRLILFIVNYGNKTVEAVVRQL